MGDPASVNKRLDPLVTVPPVAAVQTALPTVQLRTVPAGTMQSAAAATQVLPVWIGPDHDTTLVLDGQVAVLVKVIAPVWPAGHAPVVTTGAGGSHASAAAAANQ